MKLFWLSFALLGACASQAVTLFDTDTFSTGSDEGWGSGAVHNVTTGGGPAGAADRYMQVTGDGSTGPGGKMATKNNLSQYVGDYISAGATGFRGWFRNESNASITLRAVFWCNNGDRWTSTNSTALVLAANSGWVRHSFAINSTDLVRVSGIGTYSAALSDVYQIMLRNDSGTPSANGTQQAGRFGFDNTEVVPEPATMIALAAGLAALRRRRVK